MAEPDRRRGYGHHREPSLQVGDVLDILSAEDAAPPPQPPSPSLSRFQEEVASLATATATSALDDESAAAVSSWLDDAPLSAEEPPVAPMPPPRRNKQRRASTSSASGSTTSSRAPSGRSSPMEWLLQLERALRQGKLEFEDGTATASLEDPGETPTATTASTTHFASGEPTPEPPRQTFPGSNPFASPIPEKSPPPDPGPPSSPSTPTRFHRRQLRRHLSTLMRELPRQRTHDDLASGTATSSSTAAAPMLPTRPLAFPEHRVRELPVRLALDVLFVFPDSQQVKMQVQAAQTVRQVKEEVWKHAIEKLFSIEDWTAYEWWHGNISRREVMQRITALPTNGHFLIRDSATVEGGLALSVYHAGEVRHFRITYKQRRYHLAQSDEVFPSLSDLVAHYTVFRLPVFSVVGEPKLSVPCVRPDRFTTKVAHPSDNLFQDPRGERPFHIMPSIRKAGGLDVHKATWLAFASGDGFLHEIHHENLLVAHVEPFKAGFAKPIAELIVVHVVWKKQRVGVTSESLLTALLGSAPAWPLGEAATAHKSLTDHCLAVRASRNEAAYDLGPNLVSFPASPELTCAKLRVCVHFGWQLDSSLVKVVHLPAVHLPSEVKEQAVVGGQAQLAALGWADKGVKEFLLKVPGRFEYIEGPFPLVNFKHIRGSMLKGGNLQLQLIPRQDVMKRKWSAEEFDFALGKTQQEQEHQSAGSGPVRRPLPPQDSTASLATSAPAAGGKGPTPGVRVASTRGSSSSTAVVTPPHPLISLAGRHHEDVSVFSVWDIPFPFRVRVAGVDGLNVACMEKSNRALVRGCLNHGHVPITEPTSTPFAGVAPRVRWHSTLAFDIKTSELPRNSSLGVTLVGRRRKKGKRSKETDVDVVRAHGSIHLFDQDAILATGRHAIPLYASGEEGVTGVKCGTLFVDFDGYCKPVVYPNHGRDYVDDDTLYASDQVLFDNQPSQGEHPPPRVPGSPRGPPRSPSRAMKVDNTGDKQERTISIPGDLVELVARMATQLTGLKVTDHRVLLRRYKRSFQGSVLVHWLVSVAAVGSRADALALGERLFRLRVIRHVTDEHRFTDSTQLYCFTKFTFVRALPGSRRLSQLSRTTAMHEQFQKQSALIRKFQDRVSQAHRDHDDSKKIAQLVATDFLTPLSEEEKHLLFRCRQKCTQHANLLPKFLLSIDWSLAGHVREAYRLLSAWEARDAPHVALELLNVDYADSRVRQWAVQLLDHLADDDVEAFLLQLVQVLKFETYHDSPLARFLLRRALLNRRIGVAFFWHVRSELSEQEDPTRSLLLLQAYLSACGEGIMEALAQQVGLVDQLKILSARAVGAKGSTSARSLLVRDVLRETRLPAQCPAVYNVDVVFGEPVYDKIRVLDSKKRPVWFVARNLDASGDAVRFLFKIGDDLRQDMLTLQMIRLMDKLWQSEGVDLRMTPYSVVSTGREEGVIQVVPDATTVASIQRSSLGVFKEELLHDWLKLHNPLETQFDAAKDTFTLSCAGYCVSTYVLGIGDRHNDNIMVTKDGHFFHIDFGHFLGNIKSKFGVKRERAPFVLTPDFVYLMGKKDGPRFKQFVKHCIQAYLILRKYSDLIIGLFAMMLSTGIPELQSAEDIQYLHNALSVGMTDSQAAAYFEKLIYECLKLSWSTQLNFAVHNFAHG